MLGVVAVHNLGVLGNYLIHEVGLAQGNVVILLGELRGGALVLPIVAGHGVVVEGEGVHILAGHLHQGVGPLVVVVAGAHGDFVQLVVAVVAQEGLVVAVQVGVVLGAHVAAAAPALVAHADVLQLPGLVLAVFPAEVGHGGLAVKGHVLYPLAHLLHGAGAHVAVDVGLAAHLAAELHKLVGAKGVVLYHAAPVGVHHALAALLGANAVLPVVLIGEAAAGPAEHRQLDVPQGFHHVGAHAVDVGDGGILSHIDAVVDAAAQVLGEVAVDVLVDGALFVLLVDDNLAHKPVPSFIKEIKQSAPPREQEVRTSCLLGY